MIRSRWVAIGLGVLLAAPGLPGGAQEVGEARAEAISGPGLVMVGSGLGPITSIAHAGDSRLFIALRTGRILVWDEKGALPRSFLNLSKLVTTSLGRGLFSVAFHPRYEKNGLFFVAYADEAGNLTIARYKRSASDPNRADAVSRAVLLTIPVPADADHSGGEVKFGPDGYLYVGVGDGGAGGELSCNAQRDDVLLGKILRLDVNVNRRKAPYYGIPASNPFALAGSPMDKVWAKGLRHPRRFSFDRATGDLYIGEVGQTAREEIDFQARGSRGGENYGWRVMEGSLCLAAASASGCPAGMPPCKSPGLQKPIFEYSHEGGDCSVVGGYVYRGKHIPGISGTYFYGDSCTGRIWGDIRPMSDTAPALSTFGEDVAGELYAGTQNGNLYRIVTAGEAVPYELTVREVSDAPPPMAAEEPLPLFQPPPTPIPPTPTPALVIFVPQFPPPPSSEPGPAGAPPEVGHRPRPPHAQPPTPQPTPEPTIAPPSPTSPPRESGRLEPTPVQREQPTPRTVNPRQ